MTPDEFFYYIFSPLQRLGPGCMQATQKALSYIPSLPDNACILDIGCGRGAQTRDLAALTQGTITATDNYQPFLDAITARAAHEGMGMRIKTRCASMDNLPFKEGKFDLIWSEGAIYLIGFENGLSSWRSFSKKGGYIVVSDIAWFLKNPPHELIQFWKDENCIVNSEEEKKEQIDRTGLTLIATFRLPESGWWEHYYLPLLGRVAELKEKYGKDPAFAPILASCEYEAEIYQKYKQYYGYTFFVMQNR